LSYTRDAFLVNRHKALQREHSGKYQTKQETASTGRTPQHLPGADH